MKYSNDSADDTKRKKPSNQKMVSIILLAAILLLLLAVGIVLGGQWMRARKIALAPTPTPTLTPTPAPVVTINAIRELAELSTVEYWAVTEVRNEVIPDDLRKYLGAKEEILLLVYFKVKAGFDLGKLSEDDIWVDGDRVQLHLPAPEVLSTEIDLDRTHIVHYQKSALISRDLELERDALQMAKEALNQAIEEGNLSEPGLQPVTESDAAPQPFAVEAGVLEKAAEYGTIYFENYLRSLGFKDVRVIVD